VSPDPNEVVADLQRVVARLQQIDLWPPWNAVAAVVAAVRTAHTVASTPPAPDPADLDRAATAWHQVALHWEESGQDVLTTRSKTASPVWVGEAAAIFRESLLALSLRFESVDMAADGVEIALLDCEAPMEAARKRHAAAYGELAQNLSLHLGDLPPWKAADKLRKIIDAVIRSVNELIGAYQDAAGAVHECRTTIIAVADTITLPTVLVGSVSAIDQANLLTALGGLGNDIGPLRGSTAARAQAALDAMTPQQRARAQALLDGATDYLSRGWILAAIASGLDGQALDRYAVQLATMTSAEVKALDPTGAFWAFRQPDNTTCGSSSLVMARMINDPAYAMSIIVGYDPRTGEHAPLLPSDPPTSDPKAQARLRFGAEALAMHTQTNGLTDHDGRFNGAWPEAWGTSPGSAARQMSGGEGLSGVPGSSYQVRYVDPDNRDVAYDNIVRAVDAGHAVPMYNYEINRSDGRSGAHITLVTGTQGDNLVVYDPGTGMTVTVTREQFTTAHLQDATLGWDHPLAAVVPR